MDRELAELRMRYKILVANLRNNEWKALKVHLWKEWSEDDPRYLEYLQQREQWRKEHRKIYDRMKEIEDFIESDGYIQRWTKK